VRKQSKKVTAGRVSVWARGVCYVHEEGFGGTFGGADAVPVRKVLRRVRVCPGAGGGLLAVLRRARPLLSQGRRCDGYNGLQVA